MFSSPHTLSRGRMLALCLALLGGLVLSGWWSAQQRTGAALRADTLRLHVRADSDSVFDQTCKLAVRDAILAAAGQLWAPGADPAEARAAAARRLPDLQRAAQQTLARLGSPRPVQVSLVNMYFGTTRYEDFALPAGRYDAVRVDIGGPGSYGQNWWCVLYPGLCTAACGGYDDPAETDLVCGGYILRFRAVEVWQQLTAPRGDRVFVTLPHTAA